MKDPKCSLNNSIMQINNYIVLILLSFNLNCKSQKIKCEDRIFQLIASFKSVDINKFIGIGIESRGIDLNGDRFLRIYYSNKEGFSIRIPNLQPTEVNENPILVDSVRIKLANEINLPDSTSKYYIIDLIVKCKEIFLSQNLKEINSQRRLGDFIEFVFDNNCSVYYKADGVWLDEIHTKMFENAKIIEKNWYILSRNRYNMVLDTIPKYIIKNDDTIFLNYPIDVKKKVDFK